MGTTSTPSDQTTTEQPHEPYDPWADHWAEPHERCVRCLRPAVDFDNYPDDFDATLLIDPSKLRATWRTAKRAPWPEDGDPGVCRDNSECLTTEEWQMVEAIKLRGLLELSRARDDFANAERAYVRISLLRHVTGGGSNPEVLAMIDARKLHRMAEGDLEQIEMDLASEGPGPAVLSVVAPIR